jgi:putative thioredoxin
MGTSVTVDRQNFAAEVVQKSHEKPVLVDFYATWCGPCQMLKPMLEKLAKEYDFQLAKIDIDQNPELAKVYGVEGVPDVRIVTQGRFQKGFVGVLPEPQLRELMSQLNLKSGLEAGLETLHQIEASGNVEAVQQQYAALIQQFPENRPLAIAAAKFFLKQGQTEMALMLLDSIRESERDYYSQAQAVKSLVQFQQILNDTTPETELDELYLKGIRLALNEDYEGALQTLLGIVGRDRKYRNDAARKTMITLFDLLGDSHPLTRDYRKQLTQTLY